MWYVLQKHCFCSSPEPTRPSAAWTLSDAIGRVPIDSWDIGIHIGVSGQLPSTFNRLKLAINRRFVCASPAYVAQAGAPECPDDLTRHACLAIVENNEDVTFWKFSALTDGNEHRIRIDRKLCSNDGAVVKNWAIAGLGIIMRSEWDVADNLYAGRLVRILDQYALPTADILALIGSKPTARAARTTHFLNMLKRAFSPPPWLV